MNSISFHTLYPLVGPTRAPVNVRIIDVGKTKVNLAWKPIPYSHQNGIILYYVVRCDPVEHPENLLEQESQVEGKQVYGNEMATNRWIGYFSELCPNTEYTVRVAGATDAGVGVFSWPITFKTLEGKH